MKKLLLLALMLIALPGWAQYSEVPLGDSVQLEDVLVFDSTGAETAADSAPSCSVFEMATDAAIVTGTMTLRSSTTNDYRFAFNATVGNGFEIGKWYNTICSATVDSLLQNIPKGHFRIRAPELVAGAVMAAVGTSGITTNSFTAGSINAAAIAADAIGASEIAAGAIAADAFAAGAIDAAALAADAGTEIGTAVWATTTRQLTGTQTFNLTGNITGNLTGSVGSVTGAVGSVTGNVGGSVASVVGATTVGNIQSAALAQLFSVDSGTTYGAAVAGSVVKEIADNSAAAGFTVQQIVDSVWGHTIAVCAGSTGTTCEALNAAASAGDPWVTALPGGYGAGSAGYILGNQVVRTSVNNRPLDVSAAGNAGIDWANVESADYPVGLTNTTIATTQAVGVVASVTGNVGGNVVGTVASVVGDVGGNVVGNVNGNVVGSVSSVTGNVGSVTGNVGGNVVGSVASVVGAVGSVTGAVGSVTGNVGGNVVGTVASVVDRTGFSLSSAGVTSIWTETLPELTQGVPSATPTAREALMTQFTGIRNTVTVSNTLKTFSNDAGTVLFKKALSDSGTLFTESEAISGP